MPYGGAIGTRIAQLSGEPIPPRRPQAKLVILSLLGLALIISLAMCIGQAMLGL